MTDQNPQSTAEVGDVWDSAAAGWIRNADLVDRMSVTVRQWIVDHIDAKPGETVLELAAGAGDTGIQIAPSLGDDGRLISSDISPHMMQAAEQRAKDRGVTNAEFRVMDAQRIDLEDESVDAVVHRYGPMLLPDPLASFKEVRRVLRPGGRYACAVWAGPDRNPWILMSGMSLMQHGHQPPGGDPTGPGGMFSLADPDVFRQRVAEAGFEDVQLETVENPFEFTSFDEFWKIPNEIAAPIAAIIAGLNPEQVEAVKDTFKGMAEQFRSGEAYRPRAETLCILAR